MMFMIDSDNGDHYNDENIAQISIEPQLARDYFYLIERQLHYKPLKWYYKFVPFFNLS